MTVLGVSGQKLTRMRGCAVSENSQAIGARLNERLALAGLDRLDPTLAAGFGDYCSLLQRWNARFNLTAIRDEEGILTRHFVESIACARALPAGIRTGEISVRACTDLMCGHNAADNTAAPSRRRCLPASGRGPPRAGG